MKVAIFGATGGIGRALVTQLINAPGVTSVYGAGRSGASDVSTDEIYTPLTLDLTKEESIAEACVEILQNEAPALSIIASGFLSETGGLQPERTFKQQSAASFETLFAINTIGPALIAKHLLPGIPRKGRHVIGFLSARVGSISDNRVGGWHAYRASKAALNMLIKNYAIELSMRKSEAICVGLHPGTVDTPLSQPFQRNLQEGQVISAESSARHLLDVCQYLTLADSGRVFDWKGEPIPA